jgi:hypothetical protein
MISKFSTITNRMSIHLETIVFNSVVLHRCDTNENMLIISIRRISIGIGIIRLIKIHIWHVRTHSWHAK